MALFSVSYVSTYGKTNARRNVTVSTKTRKRHFEKQRQGQNEKRHCREPLALHAPFSRPLFARLFTRLCGQLKTETTEFDKNEEG